MNENGVMHLVFFVSTLLKLCDKLTVLLIVIILTEVSADLYDLFDHLIETVFARNMQAVDVVVICVLQH